MTSRPNIRFEGYTDDWEQRKFGEVTTLKSASRVHREEWKESGVPFYRSSDVMSAINGTENEKAFISEELYEKLSSVSGKLEEGDVLVTGGGSVGNPYIVPDNKPLYTKDADLLWIKNQGRFDAYFIYEFFFSPTFRSYLGSVSHVGTIAHYTITQLSETPVALPSLEEQKKIGDYFKSLDNLITLHQRKCDETKELKKYMLQKMFPKNGEKRPEIRFEGFNDDWEQRKLSECAGFRRGSFPQPYGNKEWYDGEGAMPFVQVADVADDMKLVDDTKQKISKVAQPMSVYADKGSVLVTLQGSIGRVAITQYGAFVDRTVLIFDKYNQDIDKTFWAYIIKEKFIDEARKAPGGTIKTITKEALSDFDLMLPNYDEQKKLGAFLVSIDNLITLYQRKCDELKEVKKFMLQNMFPGRD